MGEPMPKLHIHAVLAEGCCARPRILEPFAMMGTVPGVKCTSSTEPSDVAHQMPMSLFSKDFDRFCTNNDNLTAISQFDTGYCPDSKLIIAYLQG